MPFAIDRRSFLKQSAGGAALAAFASHFTLAEGKSNHNTRIALLSDIHIAADPHDSYRGFYPSQNLRRVLQQVSESHFDTMLINGDLARLEGKPADYSAIANDLEPVLEKLPLLITLGNHDDRKSARNGITDFRGAVQPVEKKLVMTFDAGPVNLVLLDSLMATNVAAGQLGHSQRAWLEQEVHSLNKPTVVFVHHNLDPNDDNALVDARALLDILRPASRVKAIVFGHTHAWGHTQTDGLHLVNIPAVAYNFEDSEPIGWVEASFTDRNATLRLHAIGGNTALGPEVLELKWR
jgi:3',5'-cyclic-AMP phosphodiesterase